MVPALRAESPVTVKIYNGLHEMSELGVVRPCSSLCIAFTRTFMDPCVGRTTDRQTRFARSRVTPSALIRAKIRTLASTVRQEDRLPTPSLSSVSPHSLSIIINQHPRRRRTTAKALYSKHGVLPRRQCTTTKEGSDISQGAVRAFVLRRYARPGRHHDVDDCTKHRPHE
jgi:hypothetical protein